MTKEEVAWNKHVQPSVGGFIQKVQELGCRRREPATLEWAKKITDSDLGVLDGTKRYDRDA